MCAENIYSDIKNYSVSHNFIPPMIFLGVHTTYPVTHFLGNFREKTKKVPTRTVSRKLPDNYRKFPKKLTALLPLANFRKGNFSDSRKFLKSSIDVSDGAQPPGVLRGGDL